MSKRGETRETILDAATKVFFQNGFEKTSVKMILEEAGVVTGSFYHFFPSKEALFEAVVEKYLRNYSQRISDILSDGSLNMEQIVDKTLAELSHTAEEYYLKLQGDQLHWTVQSALHDITVETMVEPLSQAIGRLKERGEIKNCLNVADITLARILIRGMESMIHESDAAGTKCDDPAALKEGMMEFCNRILL